MLTARWRMGLTLAVVMAGLILGRVDGAAPAAGRMPRPVAQKSQAQINREIFDAIHSMLAAARVPIQDMPRQIISVESTGSQRYKVHMGMVQGDAWFEATWDGTKWQVRGLPLPPAAPPRSPG